MTIIYVMRDFADWTAIPGFNQIINALNAWVRAAWLLAISAMWGVFIYEMVVIFQTYFGYPSQVFQSDTYKYEALYPLVTICNKNPLRYTIVQSDGQFNDINLLMVQYKSVIAANYGNVSKDTFGFNNVSGTFNKDQYARNALILLMGQLSTKDIIAASYPFDEFILSWFWNNESFNSLVLQDNVFFFRTFFTQFFDPVYGLCYQFDGNSSNIFAVQRGGSTLQLRATILANQYTPTGLMEYLPTTQSVGLRVAVTYQNADPAVNDFGFDVDVGTETLVGMTWTEVRRAKHPYGDCVDNVTGSLNYYPTFNYTLSNCIRSCMQNRMIKECKCSSPLYARPSNASALCTTDQLFCFYNQSQNEETNPKSFDPYSNCSCHPSCLDTEFSVTSFYGDSPLPTYIPLGQPDTTISGNTSEFDGQTGTCIAWYQNNAAVLNIYFQDLDYILQPEESSYTITNLANDLGGQMGFWTGLSLVCLLELMAFIVVISMYLISGRRVTDPNPTDEYRSKDDRYARVRNFREELDTHEIMDDEIRLRYREYQMRPERKRAERIERGMELNDAAVARLRAQQPNAFNPEVPIPGAPGQPAAPLNPYGFDPSSIDPLYRPASALGVPPAPVTTINPFQPPQ